ncbi:LAME_0E06062g1_1 [Lachancea meyersii CBS 8951]|uniref:LAME_0E06062g1_1 n=1 Tax=Lachancea meyersii CBS 8951 TaxID=1266667 RepID=A0A1G4JHL6_9SACH|nr:LAME_0E06062g1_1 [Lachancea meyersii CBS 8951]
MSNQSGITANEALLSQIGSLINDTSSGAVVVAEISLDNTTVGLHSVLPSLEKLRDFASQNVEPLYFFIREGSGIIFVSYVPETSPVRAKMLYASTKNTVLRQVGSNHVSQQLLLSLPEELTSETWSSLGSGENAPLTEAEQISSSISEQQQLEHARGGHQLVSQTGGTSHTLSFKISSGQPIPDLLEKYNLLIFSINLAKEQVEVLETTQISETSQIISFLRSDHPTYNLYNSQGKLHFIYSCPSGSKVKERMLYASNKSGFITHLADVDKLTLDSVSEIGDASELELSKLDHPTAKVLDTSKPAPGQLKFSRPKRPGRRA